MTCHCDLVHRECTPVTAPPAARVLEGDAAPMTAGPPASTADVVAAGLVAWFAGTVVATAAVMVVMANVPLDVLASMLGAVAGG